MKLTNEELNELNGGISLTSAGIGLLVVGAVSFLLGVFDGVVNPKTCNVS